MQHVLCVSDELLGHGYGWSPVNLEVMVGDTVEWCWEGPVPTVSSHSSFWVVNEFIEFDDKKDLIQGSLQLKASTLAITLKNQVQWLMQDFPEGVSTYYLAEFRQKL